MSRPAPCEELASDTSSICYSALGLMIISGTVFEDLSEDSAAAISIDSTTNKVHITTCFFIKCEATSKDEGSIGAVSIISSQYSTITRCLFKRCIGSYTAASLRGEKGVSRYCTNRLRCEWRKHMCNYLFNKVFFQTNKLLQSYR